MIIFFWGGRRRGVIGMTLYFTKVDLEEKKKTFFFISVLFFLFLIETIHKEKLHRYDHKLAEKKNKKKLTPINKDYTIIMCITHAPNFEL